jgi:hypothetical protein
MMTTPFETKLGPRLIAAGLSLAILGSITLAAYATTATTATPVALTYSTEPSVIVFDQKVASDQINVDYANLPSAGYVVIYSSGPDGKPAKTPIGYAELKAGDHRNFKVKLTTAPHVGTALWASIYIDADGKAGFDPAKDSSIWSAAIPSSNRFLVK